MAYPFLHLEFHASSKCQISTEIHPMGHMPMYVFAFLHLSGSEQCRLLVLQMDLKLLPHLNLWGSHPQTCPRPPSAIQQHRQLILQL